MAARTVIGMPERVRTIVTCMLTHPDDTYEQMRLIGEAVPERSAADVVAAGMLAETIVYCADAAGVGPLDLLRRLVAEGCLGITWSWA